MESFGTSGQTGPRTGFQIDEVHEVTPDLIDTLVEIDLQTFSESTFSEYAAAAMLRNGRVYLLSSGDQIIGTCVTMRCWDRPNEAMILSMGIKPGWRGQGLGQHFIRGVLQKLRQRGLRSACLYVGTDNRRAIRVYEDVGFTVVERALGNRGDRAQLHLLRVTFQDSQPVIELS
ncbi:MAG: GNAT family N-acetyltransferase [Myxococcota bacterium]